MKWSLYIGKPAGIKVFIHWTFILLVIWLSWMHLQLGHGLFEIITGLFFLVLLFACVTLHEFGHALAARQYGIDTQDINLLPIGGVARLERMPEDPRQELVVAAAGPAVNVVIAIVLFLLIIVTGQSQLDISHHVTGSNFLSDLLAINIILVLFNLIPAFPMDGGRMLRALLAFKMKRAKATQVAASVGQLLAIGFILFGLFYNPFLLFIGVFVFLGAGAESRQVSMAESMKLISAKDVMTGNFQSISLSATVAQATSLMLENQSSELVVTNGDQFVGIVSFRFVIQAIQEGKSEQPIIDLIQEDVKTFEPNLVLADVIDVLRLENQTLYPVIENGKLKGIITHSNLNKILLDKQAAPQNQD
ncbi:site-2 protease family protein [Aliifodinibius salipaludis]|uniref:Zinc metalloprotease n=1 Tax=Fodinibius salipaludis TaxID=2032627 RepID=A0A2A2G9K9_9BACT|nr:site-2 protease family protein [Aliifodinibius salipaludis]PAU94271.1 site-2 protease family protein [Aliifodinibius salipaludis]